MKKIAFFIRNFQVGGIQKAMVSLLGQLDYSRCRADVFYFEDEPFYELPQHENLRYVLCRPYPYAARLVPFVLLRRYYVFYGLHTVAKVISRWAPPADGNDTDAYIRQVERIAEIHPDYELADPKADPLTWLRIVWAMTCVENGSALRDWPDHELILTQMVQGMVFAQVTWGKPLP